MCWQCAPPQEGVPNFRLRRLFGLAAGSLGRLLVSAQPSASGIPSICAEGSRSILAGIWSMNQAGQGAWFGQGRMVSSGSPEPR